MLTIKIKQDLDANDPRKEDDHLGTIVYWHKRYTIGDVNGEKEYNSPQEFLEWAEENNAIMLPVYMYDHSGVTISTGSFSCHWDSGQIGWIYVLPDKVRKEYSVKDIDEKTRELVLSVLRGEIKEFDQYLTGDVWGYIIEDEDGNVLDSCWGFYGEDVCREEAEAEKKGLEKHLVEANVGAGI